MNITELCVNCKQNNSCTMCWKTSKKKCPHFIQKTNADRIRAMSDEELAEFIRTPFCDRRTNEECKLSYCGVCEVCVMDWLKRLAEE